MSCKVTYDLRYSESRGHYFRGRIRIIEVGKEPFNHSEHFEFESDAKAWCDDVEKALKRGECILRFCTNKIKLADLVAKTLKVRGAALRSQEKSGIRRILKHSIAHAPLSKLCSSDVVQYARELYDGGKIKRQTVNWYINYLNNVLVHAESSCRIKVNNLAVKNAWKTLWSEKLIDKSSIRDRVIDDNSEGTDILEACIDAEKSSRMNIPYAKIYRIVMAQSLRRSAIIGGLKRKHINFKESLIKVEKQQNKATNKGEPEWCPMLPETREVLEEMGFHESDGINSEHTIFPFNPNSVTTGFTRILNRLGVKDIQVFRDGRRTAISSLDDNGYSLAKIRTVSTHSAKSKTLEEVYIKSDIKKVAQEAKVNLPSRRQKAAREGVLKNHNKHFHQQAADMIVKMISREGKSPDDILNAVFQVMQRERAKSTNPIAKRVTEGCTYTMSPSYKRWI